MSTTPPTVQQEELPEVLSEEEFFQNVPPGQSKLIKGFSISSQGSGYTYFDWELKDLLLYCTSDECSGYRKFQRISSANLPKKNEMYSYIVVRCRNCERTTKRFAIKAKYVDDATVELYKLGEIPQFGPPNPNKLMNIMGAERDYYLKGRRCENQSLGIAAFAYYRRVVENQKAKIIGEILKVAQKLNADQELIEDLKAAKEETRFTEAINRIKHGLPQALLINGHNPLILLHSALSEGLHAESDEVCLELATSIRIVLTDLVERMAAAVKEEAELTSAVQRLLKAGGKR